MLKKLDCLKRLKTSLCIQAKKNEKYSAKMQPDAREVNHQFMSGTRRDMSGTPAVISGHREGKIF
ncbi:MAG: hypothetical protein H6581_13375 [Bacteroidia bacterium]|nr:hypothetical protein [Bacteroidia bacterium]